MLENKLYLIEHKEITNENVVYTIRQNKNNEIFKAHFPGNPITPGACLIEIAKELCEHFVGKKLTVQSVKNVKVISLITPIANEFLKFHIATTTEDDAIHAKVQILAEENVCSKINFVLA